MRFSSTAAYWPDSPIRRRTACASRATSSPATVARPASARSSVARMRTVVVLPAPFGPSSPSTVPSRTSRSTPSSARTSPPRVRNTLTSPSASITAMRPTLAAASRTAAIRLDWSHARVDRPEGHGRALRRAPRHRLRVGERAGAAAVLHREVRSQLHAHGGPDAGRRSPRRPSRSRCSGSGRIGAGRCGCCRPGWRSAGQGSGSPRSPRATGSCVVLVFLSGLGIAAYHPEGAKFAVFASGRKRASGMSLFNIGGNTGYALGPIVVTPLVLWLGLGPGGLLASIPVVLGSLAVLAALPYLSAAAPGAGGARSGVGGGGQRACDGGARRRDRAAQRRLVRAASPSCRSGSCRSATRRPTATACSR